MRASEADAAFDRDIPEADRDEVMTMIAEAAHNDDAHPDFIDILDRDRIDAINVRANGILTWKGQEFRFIVEDGNWNGTVLEDWEGDTEFKPLPRTEWALQPLPSIVGEAIAANNGQFLINKWDIFLTRSEVAEIPRKYSYDRTFAPGLVTETYWREQAAKYKMELVSKETANETRQRLERSQGDAT
jgi:hypothetical protein